MSAVITLTSAEKMLLATAVTNHTSVEASDKELFLFAWKQYKNVKKSQRGAVSTILNKELETYTKSINIQRAVKGVFKTAQIYCDMTVVCKFDNLEYTNINNLVKLFKWVDKNASDKAVELRTTIAAIWEDGMSPHRYNNAVAEKITQLKEQYKLVDTENGFVYQDFHAMFKQALKSMTAEQLLEIMAEAEEQYEAIEVVEEGAA